MWKSGEYRSLFPPYNVSKFINDKMNCNAMMLGIQRGIE
jgi:hypothetical protein